jgi:GTP-binding protein
MELNAVRATPPVKAALEKVLGDIKVDEPVEVTPKSVSLRKARLEPNGAQACVPTKAY